MTDNVIHLRRRGDYIEVQDCDLELEQRLREAFSINGPTVSMIAEFRDALTKQQHGDEVVEALQLALATFRASSMQGRPVNVTAAVDAIERALRVCAGE